MLTAFVQAQDSIKFSAEETKAIISEHINYPKLKKIVANCEQQEIKFNQTIKKDSIDLAKCNSLVQTKDRTIDLTEDQVSEKLSLYENEHFWKRFWKKFTGWSALTALIEGGIIYLIK